MAKIDEIVDEEDNSDARTIMELLKDNLDDWED